MRPERKRRLTYGIGVVLFYLFFLRPQKYSHEIEIIVESANPKSVWEFWADFSNWQKLNPTVLEVDILSEHGNYDNWVYSVQYLEYLPSLRFWTFWNYGKYQVIAEKKGRYLTQPATILSEHKSCITRFYCSHTDSQMVFKPLPSRQGTKIIENVTYDCPPILSFYCNKEFKEQRKLISEKIEQLDSFKAFD